jgi:hypothetical protein
MKPTAITKKQFVGWLIVFTLGMALWASPGQLFLGLGVGLVSFANLSLMTPDERSRPMRLMECWWALAALLVCAVLLFASKRWLPENFGAPFARVVRHPAFVGIVWALVVWLTYRRQYKATKIDGYSAA